MKLIVDVILGEIIVDVDMVTSLIIEKPSIFMKLLKAIYYSVNSDYDGIILSNNNEILKPAKTIELITSYIPIDINEKRLLSKINLLLEKEAANENNYMETMNILSLLERYIVKLTEEFPYMLDYSSISISALIKMCGLTINDDSSSDIEKVFNYINLVTELLGERLFVLANMHAFFDDDDIQLFVDTVVAHKLNVLLIDCAEYGKINNARRVIIDKDLCVI